MISLCRTWSLAIWHNSKASVVKSNHCYSFEDGEPIDLIYGCLIFKWAAETWLHSQGTRRGAPAKAARWHALLTHWDRVTHICVGKLTIIGSDNGLSPERRQAIIWTNAGILLIGPLGTNFSEILIEIQTFSLKKIRLKMSSAKCCSFRLGLNVLSNV